ncbi:MAG: Gfo/Idh/MocA family oxidoreductase [Bryobacteraceae bacterium]|nr:Gfo/Idh/MocA family oxidoreductase [Bryobacterales bacterium]MEB2359950.1 Gfo/Idh/MocA family oxidoreductase [Bryobacterales bacterium]NUN00409.1 Gfo/Idh/MocA family oxidoreductase [Bryobacteraceae bacterium]
MQRRNFMEGGIAALSARRVLGANDRIRAGLIGCGGRGRYVAGLMARSPGVEFTAVCDVYAANAAAALRRAGAGARACSDFRKLLDDKDIDIVLIATPDHWHAIPAILACEAGKDVYVEKPLAHNVREGRAMVAAARRYNRIVQTGTQQRSAPHFAEVAGIIQSGELGDVRFVRVWNFSNMTPDGIGREADSDVPEGLDWDMYLGPAPQAPFNRKRFLGTFRWFWDYAGGTITDFGTHRFDTVHQIMGVDAPEKVSASGGRFTLRDAGEMPDVLQVTYDYPGFVLSYEASNISAHGLGGRTAGMRYYNARGAEDRPNGMAFYGTNGALFADRIGYEIYPDFNRSGNEPRISARRRNTTDATELHARNFVEAVRGRRRPAADVETGHRSTLVGHLGNIAFKTGKKLKWDAGRESFVQDAEADRLLGRTARKPWDLIPVI